MSAAPRPLPPLEGRSRWIGGVVLAMANFVVVLDTTIANVSVPNIAGGLGVSTSEGTWVITSYAVADGVTVVLTGWLVGRFGAARTFVAAMTGFALWSALCGLAPSLAWLVIFRVLQGLAGGPMISSSQTLLLRIFPEEKRATALGVWSVTTVVGPVAGPILGGWISDNIGWPWVFLINVPVAFICAFLAWRIVARRDNPTANRPIDYVGLGLLVVWVAALQIMLDRGHELDWFGSARIIALAVLAALGLVAFLAWELTEPNPVVNLSVFRYRGYAIAAATLTVCWAAFFATVVMVPLWLQTGMGYTPTWAGCSVAANGVLAFFLSFVFPKISVKFDPRLLISFGMGWLAFIAVWRAGFATNMTFAQITLPQLMQGIGFPFFFTATMSYAMSQVTPAEIPSAAGLISAARTIGAAFGTSIVTSAWQDITTADHVRLAGIIRGEDGLNLIAAAGFEPFQATSQLELMVQNQALMLATDRLFLVTAVVFVLAGCAIWLAPPPKLRPSAGPPSRN